MCVCEGDSLILWRLFLRVNGMIIPRLITDKKEKKHIDGEAEEGERVGIVCEKKPPTMYICYTCIIQLMRFPFTEAINVISPFATTLCLSYVCICGCEWGELNFKNTWNRLIEITLESAHALSSWNETHQNGWSTNTGINNSMRKCANKRRRRKYQFHLKRERSKKMWMTHTISGF